MATRGMGRKELARWTQQLVRTGMRFIAQDGACPSTALVAVTGTPVSMEFPVTSEADRRLLRAYFEMAARGGAAACALVTEGWSLRGPRAFDRAAAARRRGGSLATLRGRGEQLVVHAVSPAGEVLRAFRIVREAGRIALVVEPPTKDPGPWSRFLSDLPWAS